MIAALLAALISGTFALQHGVPQTSGHLEATKSGPSPLREGLDAWLDDRRAHTVRRYVIDMTKFQHLIVISDDFSYFAHVHPALGADGHFHIDHRFPKPALYHIYTDAEPAAFGQQVFRFDLPVGDAMPAKRTLAPTPAAADVDGYRVSLGSEHLPIGREAHVSVRITKNGKPATDLHPYLGALAHAVFIDANDLSYLHVHPMPAGGASDAMASMSATDMPASAPLSPTSASSPDMLLHVRVARPGLYKLWLQFRGGTALHVASFVMRA